MAGRGPVTAGRSSTLDTSSLKMTVFAALMTALMAAGAYIVLPIGPVPIVLSNLFVLLAGLLLGPRWGGTAVALYLLLGAVGLPVFSGGGGGIGHLAGPTGGYLLGYLPAVVVVGVISRLGAATGGSGVGQRRRPLFDLAAVVSGTAVVYGCGILWLVAVRAVPLRAALSVGLLPFLPADALKIAAALPLARFGRPLIERRGAWR